MKNKLLGKIHLQPQPLEEWGDRRDHADATIVLDTVGRQALIDALVNGSESVQAIGESGGEYRLNIVVEEPGVE